VVCGGGVVMGIMVERSGGAIVDRRQGVVEWYGVLEAELHDLQAVGSLVVDRPK